MTELTTQLSKRGMPPQEYRGYTIEEKRDFGNGHFLIEGRKVRNGFVVVRWGCNVMPGGTWFQTIEDAERAIDILEDEFGGPPTLANFQRNPRYDNARFWKLVRGC